MMMTDTADTRHIVIIIIIDVYRTIDDSIVVWMNQSIHN